MRKSNKLYTVILFLAVFFTTSVMFSQSIIQGDPDPEVAELARETADMWARELGLTSKQELLMRKKLVEFGMRRQELLDSKMNEAAKKERMIVLQEEERADMSDILTRPQLDRYLKIQRERLAEAAKDGNQ